MKTVVAAPEDLWEELSTTIKMVECVRVSDPVEFYQFSGDAVFFNLCEGAEKLTYPEGDLVFINSVSHTLNKNPQHQNVCRINAWKGFLKRDKWEIAGKIDARLQDYCASIEKQILAAPDVAGFVSSRILSMIINEAYFALEEGVSTKSEIDTAMKLGTNYPKGPFEWSKEIGLKKVHELLEVLSKDDPRYTPAPLLIKESEEL